MVCTSGNGRTGDTFCFSGGSGGPNEDDCAVIADAILYDSQNVGAIFNATAPGTATDKVTMQYKSCLTYFLNQDSANETLSYCRSDWVSPSLPAPAPRALCGSVRWGFHSNNVLTDHVLRFRIRVGLPSPHSPRSSPGSRATATRPTVHTAVSASRRTSGGTSRSRTALAERPSARDHGHQLDDGFSVARRRYLANVHWTGLRLFDHELYFA